MGSLLKTTVVVVGFLLLLLPAAVYSQVQRFVEVYLFSDKNCTVYLPFIAYIDNSEVPNVTFPANPSNLTETFESAFLKNYTGAVLSLVACQAQLPCDTTGAFQISFNLSDLGACSTEGPPGTQFDTFLLS